MDLARVVAAFWVVTIHVAAVPVVHMNAVPIEWWWWANVYNSLSRAAVPLFVMISGALLLNASRWDMATFFRKRTAKLLVPMIGWTVIYATWRAWLRDEPLDAAEMVGNLLNGLNTPAYPHLWFLWVIASLYLLTPVFQRFVAHATLREHLYFGLLWFAVTAVLPLLQRFTGWQLGVMLQPAFGYVGYYVVGASLHRFLAPRLGVFHMAAMSVIFVAGAWVAAWATHALSVGQAKVDESFMEPLAGNVMLMALSAFVILRHVGTVALGAGAVQRGWVPHALILRLSTWSFGIYLAHPLMLDLLDLLLGLSLDPMRHHTGWYVPAMALLAFAMAAILTGALRAMPGLRRLVP